MKNVQSVFRPTFQRAVNCLVFDQRLPHYLRFYLSFTFCDVTNNFLAQDFDMAIITVIFGGLLSWVLAACVLAAGLLLSQAILAFFVTNVCVLALGLTAAYRRPHNAA